MNNWPQLLTSVYIIWDNYQQKKRKIILNFAIIYKCE